MKQKHYYVFEENMIKKMKENSLNKKNWELLRNDEVDGPFSIEKTVETYEANCENGISYKKVAQIIFDELKVEGRIDKKIVSLGVGKGILEWHLKSKHSNMST